jgi:hypothetical protein
MSLSKRDPRPVAEGAVLKAVKQFCYYRGIHLYRRNIGAMKGSYKGKPWFVKFSEPGMADLSGWTVEDPQPGRHVEVEVKAPGKKPSAAQLAWLEQARAGGCVAFWCDSTEMCEAKLKEWGL